MYFSFPATYATCSNHFILYEQIILLAVGSITIFMEAIPSGLSLNKLHLLSITQHKFILIQTVPLHVCCMFQPDMPEDGLCIG
jgi:hypothetical protein